MIRESTEHEFAYSREDFERVRKALQAKTGIRLADSKDAMVYSRLARRLRALSQPSFAAYLALLERTPTEEEFFVNALTTNLTAFFREPHHFQALREYLENARRPLTIWSCASSTGEEPYSIAMTVVDVYRSFRPPVTLIASDIDSSVLQTARNGIYPADITTKLTSAQCQQYLYRGTGSNAGKVRIVKELRNLISFRQLNLLSPQWPLRAPVDIIFCRNVMIYFDKPTQFALLRKMIALMPDDGRYFAGHSENFNSASELVRPLGKTLYQPAPNRQKTHG